jgi:hypothetical protein
VPGRKRTKNKEKEIEIERRLPYCYSVVGLALLFSSTTFFRGILEISN